MKTLILLTMLAALTACGVKSDLTRPNGQTTPHSEKDPSLPPSSNGH